MRDDPKPLPPGRDVSAEMAEYLARHADEVRAEIAQLDREKARSMVRAYQIPVSNSPK